MKVCAKCGEEKNAEAFDRNGGQNGGLHPYCKACRSDLYRERKEADPDKYRERGREATRKYRKANPIYRVESYCQGRYGKSAITILEYVNRRIEHNGMVCPICNRRADVVGRVKTKGTIRLVLDHDHRSGKLRDLICDNCNKALGNVRDEIGTLHNMMDYLEKWREEG